MAFDVASPLEALRRGFEETRQEPLCRHCIGNSSEESDQGRVFAEANGVLCRNCMADPNTFGWFYSEMKGRFAPDDLPYQTRQIYDTGFFDAATAEWEAQWRRMNPDAARLQGSALLTGLFEVGKAYGAAHRVVGRRVKEIKETLRIA